MNDEHELVRRAYGEVIMSLFVNFADNWSAAHIAQSAQGIAAAERAYSDGLRLRRAALEKALSLTDNPGAP